MTNASNASQGYVPRISYQQSASTPQMHSFNTSPFCLSMSRNQSVMTDTSILSTDSIAMTTISETGRKPQKYVRAQSDGKTLKSRDLGRRPKQRSTPANLRTPIPYTSQRRTSQQMQQKFGQKSSDRYTAGQFMYLSLGDGVAKWEKVKLLTFLPKSREWIVRFNDRSEGTIVEMALHTENSYRVLSNNDYTTNASEYGGSHQSTRSAYLRRGSHL